METNSTIQLPANMTIDKVEGDKIFLKPVFEDGDVLVSGKTGEPFIYNGEYNIKEDDIGCYIGIGSNGKLNIEPFLVPTYRWSSFCKARKATEQEKEKLFKAISDAGYIWNRQPKELKKLEKELPKTWKEFCRMYPEEEEDKYYIEISTLGEEKAEAMSAFIRLIRLRECYRNGWKPILGENVYYIEYSLSNGVGCFCTDYYNRVLSFQSSEVRDMFFENFRDLIEQAKELI